MHWAQSKGEIQQLSANINHGCSVSWGGELGAEGSPA